MRNVSQYLPLQFRCRPGCHQRIPQISILLNLGTSHLLNILKQNIYNNFFVTVLFKQKLSVHTMVTAFMRPVTKIYLFLGNTILICIL